MNQVYYKFYMQKEGTDASGAAYPIVELGSDFSLFETESKFYGNRAVKDIPSRSWTDEDGDDEFVPSEYKYKAYDMQVKLACKGEPRSVNGVLTKFLEYLSGGTFKIYDSYLGIGRQSVRFVEIPDDATLYRHYDGKDEALVITLKLKVNDPVTDITLEKTEE